MPKSILRSVPLQLLWMVIGACRDDAEPDRPEVSAPIYPAVGADGGKTAVDAGLATEDANSQGQAGGSAEAGGGDASAASDELPCEVASFLRARCTSCHGAQPVPGVPMSLVSYADLERRSATFPDETHAQRALLRVQMGSMPPGGGLSAAEIQVFAAWVQAGAQPTSCASPSLDAGAGAGPDDAGGARDGAAPDARASDASATDGGGAEAGPSEAGIPDAAGAAPDAGTNDASQADAGDERTCTSDRYWTDGARRSALMSPGKPCLTCHTASTPQLSLAGTVYPSVHEPDDCNGALGNGVSVLIKAVNGQRLALTPNAVGNFFAQTGISGPYTVEIHYQGRVGIKTQPQTNGDCNACHSEGGTNGAAGRIRLP
jgi:hypothetical protein